MFNYEIKTKISNLDEIIQVIKNQGAKREGFLKQKDYYLKVGRYKKKIREINNEAMEMISYTRNEKMGRKDSEYKIIKLTPKQKEILLIQNNPVCFVEKTRELWIYKNTRIHFDKVMGLGDFIELETVVNQKPKRQSLREFKEVVKLLKLDTKKAISFSYSDLVLNKS
jgi:predicted adenylyl cyclase CyaB